MALSLKKTAQAFALTLGALACAGGPSTTADRAATNASRLVAEQRHVEAIRELSIASRYEPDPDRLMELAELLLEAGQTRRAAQALGRATELAPERVDLWIRLGDVEEIGQRYESAFRALGHALELEPNRIEIAKRRDMLQDRIQAIERARKAAGNNEIPWRPPVATERPRTGAD